MKKTFILFLLALLGVGAQAQQLPNGDFEGTWVDCNPWTSNGTTTVEKTPTDWCIANVAGYPMTFFGSTSWIGRTTVGSKISGYNSSSAVKLTCGEVYGNKVPGYMTLGTSWNTSVMGKQNDGGSFGGKPFTYRPDALSFMFQHGNASGSTQPFSVVAYMWKGSTTQTDVPAAITASGTPKTATLVDRDRNILGITTIKGNTTITTSQGFQRIAKIVETGFTDQQNSWTKKTIDFTYEAQGVAPEKINVIFAACNYFEQDQEKDDWLSIDDVKLLYYSQLSNIKVNGEAISGFDANTYSYNVEVPYYSTIASAQASLECTVKGQAATAQVTHNADNTVITVTNSQGSDGEGLNTHTYTLHYTVAAVPAGKHVYQGLLDIVMGEPLATADQKKIVLSDVKDNGKVDFVLPNFSLSSMSLGDIAINNLTVTRDEQNARTFYKGQVDNMQLMYGAISANVDVEGYIADNGDIYLNIPVTWVNEGAEIPISVRFYTSGTASFDASASLSLNGAASYGTYVAPFASALPAGVTAYTVASVDATTGKIVLEEVSGDVPAQMPVILEGANDVALTLYGESAGEADNTGCLRGVLEATEATEGDYVLQRHDARTAFYRVDNGTTVTVPANRCYIHLPETNVKALSFDIATALDVLTAPTTAPRAIYDLQGRRHNTLQKGVNIVGGVKVVVK